MRRPTDDPCKLNDVQKTSTGQSPLEGRFFSHVVPPICVAGQGQLSISLLLEGLLEELDSRSHANQYSNDVVHTTCSADAHIVQNVGPTTGSFTDLNPNLQISGAIDTGNQLETSSTHTPTYKCPCHKCGGKAVTEETLQQHLKSWEEAVKKAPKHYHTEGLAELREFLKEKPRNRQKHAFH